ncbi:hypothetical protein B566_EDAN017701 [Ephemera danica]|nr:hypothetical protein B566_EDAN017701 [Ephemera danica]
MVLSGSSKPSLLGSPSVESGYSMVTGVLERNGSIRKIKKVLPGNIRVDGYLEKNGEKHVFEFNGCYFHGCQQCYGNQEYMSHGENSAIRTATLRRLQTEANVKKLRDAGYKVTVMQECKFRKQMQDNENMRKYVTNHPLVPKIKLCVRDAFFGGHTNAIQLYHRVEPGEKILYLDVRSLYPYINKYKKYPVGHPSVFVGQDCPQLVDIEGFIHFKILPPQNLFHPVLPAKIHNKLMFVLCFKCAEALNPEECDHTDAERALLGTWVSDEVKKAVEMGYKIIEMYEVWQYQTVQFNPETQEEGLLSSYINKFLKIKVEASGWPASVDQNDKDSKQKNIADFYERETVELEYVKIEKNPGIRSVSKICLNCLWRFFGMRENKTKTTIVSDAKSLFTIIATAGVVVVNLIPISDKKMIIFTKMTVESYKPNPKTNVAIAAYTTAQARLHLYSYLEKLQEKISYMDTDSILIKVKDGDTDIPETGVFLEDLTDELEPYGPGSYIQEFVSGGPKNYTYSVYTPGKDTLSYCIKIKGMTINSSNDTVLCFETLKNMICNNAPPINVTYPQTIHRNKQFTVFTKPLTKKYQILCTKRRILTGTYIITSFFVIVHHDVVLETSIYFVVAGSTGSGKSYFVFNFLKNIDIMVDKKIIEVVWCYGADQILYDDVKKSCKAPVRFIEGLPSLSKIAPEQSPPSRLVVLDDQMREANEQVVDLFTKGSHHRNLSIIFITQNVFHQGKGQRDISLNSHYLVAMKNPRDRQQILHLARQICPENPRYLFAMSETLKMNISTLRKLKRCSPAERQKILRNADKSLICCLCEIAQNTLNNNVPLNKCQYKKLSKHKNILRRLCKKGEKWQGKKMLIKQSGGFILPLLAPILGVLLQKIL